MKKQIWAVLLLFTFIIVESSFKTFIPYQSDLSGPFIDTIHKLNTKGYYYNAESGPVKYVIRGIRNKGPFDTVNTYCDFIFFYEDSTVFIYTDIMKHFDSIQSVVGEKYFESTNKNTFKNVGRRGYYSIKENSIYVTIYRHDPSRFHTWIKEECQMNIKNNSDTLLLTQTTCKHCKNQYSDMGIRVKYYLIPRKNLRLFLFQ